MQRLTLKTAFWTALVIATNVLANYALARGLKEVGQLSSWAPTPYVRALSHPWVMLGVVAMIAWLITRLTLFSWADLSYVVPVTSFSYVLTAIVARFFLHERITALDWTGIAVLTAGVMLVAATQPHTDDREQAIRPC